MKALLTTLAALALTANAPLAQTAQGTDTSAMPATADQMEGAVQARAVVNTIGDGTANVSHDPIPEIGWPAMTMDLPLLEGAGTMGEVAEGDSVTLLLVKGADGMYAIGAMMPD